jgi:hypothetical protein
MIKSRGRLCGNSRIKSATRLSSIATPNEHITGKFRFSRLLFCGIAIAVGNE